MVKRLFQYADSKYLIEEFMPNLSYVCKGLVFYTLNSQFSDYAWVIPKENQIVNIKRKHEVDQEFYAKYPEYAKHADIEINQLPHLAEHSPSNTGKRSLESLCSLNTVNPVFKSKYIHTDEPSNLVIMKTEIPDIYYLYTKDNHTERVGTAFVLNLAMSQALSKMTDADSSNSCVARCYYHKYFDRWIPYELVSDGTQSLTTDEYEVIHTRFQAEFSGMAANGTDKYPI